MSPRLRDRLRMPWRQITSLCYTSWSNLNNHTNPKCHPRCSRFITILQIYSSYETIESNNKGVVGSYICSNTITFYLLLPVSLFCSLHIQTELQPPTQSQFPSHISSVPSVYQILLPLLPHSAPVSVPMGDGWKVGFMDGGAGCGSTGEGSSFMWVWSSWSAGGRFCHRE
ncbi:hypothetical protein L211DRAFT_322892 [Terfezia boudieri ATCC MYA-4762]|uniref:Uncharacterized protein n=1 Tax=Terfezia boudieri ATCC MYA-4762 TaxID=1051890 RepID=A0A3N4LLW9_9PEZI|nr:hypothetical protein L211DRAFT_322892 [Terfezia boudieri ATCC MYA-4762]